DPTSPTRDINRRLLLSLHQDGLLDVLAGLIVVTFGLIPILDESGLNAGLRQVIFLTFYFVEVFGVIWLKRRITLPRTGLVELSRKTTSRPSLVMLIVNVIIFLVFAGSYAFNIPIWDLFGSYQLSIPLGLIFLIMFTVSGALLKAPRFYIYGILVMITFVLFEHLYVKGIVVHHGIPPAGFISGGLIALSGLIHLRKFLIKYRIE
ncbi:MAG: hypothetical protein KAT15_05525, partial [Bacteroidales bacterium]|nr:hypothetical protein [Bacteroidales bacterium]